MQLITSGQIARQKDEAEAKRTPQINVIEQTPGLTPLLQKKRPLTAQQIPEKMEFLQLPSKRRASSSDSREDEQAIEELSHESEEDLSLPVVSGERVSFAPKTLLKR